MKNLVTLQILTVNLLLECYISLLLVSHIWDRRRVASLKRLRVVRKHMPANSSQSLAAAAARPGPGCVAGPGGYFKYAHSVLPPPRFPTSLAHMILDQNLFTLTFKPNEDDPTVTDLVDGTGIVQYHKHRVPSSAEYRMNVYGTSHHSARGRRDCS
jgi:hypothetical protein